MDAPSIELDDRERALFDLLLAVDRDLGLGQTYRVAGGWVRDKLLGRATDDVDVALDRLTGRAFVERLRGWHRDHTGSGVPRIGRGWIVESNIEKSKHLETAGLDVGGLKVEFVNLRSETYADGSRVPEMEFGTPESDARRRDLTINALFYLVNEGRIEDLVGGLDDLREMRLRTPLEPVRTFVDDPLRALRTLRFLARYHHAVLDPEALAAMHEPRVLDAYRRKVAPERAGPELVKLFGGERVSEALGHLHATGLADAVFDDPAWNALGDLDREIGTAEHRDTILGHALRTVAAVETSPEVLELEPKDRTRLCIAAWAHDLGKALPGIARPRDDGTLAHPGHEQVSADVVESVLKRIGVGRDDREVVARIVRLHPRAFAPAWDPVAMGRLLVDARIAGVDAPDLARHVLLLAEADARSRADATGVERARTLRERRLALEAFAADPPPLDPLVDGHAIMRAFDGLDPRTGFVGIVQERLRTAQLEGRVRTADQARDFVAALSEADATGAPAD